VGLDVSYYTSVKFVRKLREDEEYFDRNENCNGDMRHLCPVDFTRQADGVDGIYAVEGEVSFRVGSYSYYNHWRDQLAQLIGESSAAAVWEKSDAGKDGPFYDLIHFSDCEGVIGPQTCDRLAQSFDVWRDRAQEHGKKIGDRDFFTTYEEFRTAFKAAAGHGCVDFN